MQSDTSNELNGMGIYQELSSGYMTSSSLGNTLESQHEQAAGTPKKKAPGLKKKLNSKVSAARSDASLG